MIKEMCALRDEYKIQLKTLKHLYNIYEQNCGDCSSSECYYLRQQMRYVERDINEMKALILDARNNLRSTIAEKDKLYDRLRSQRAQRPSHN